MTRVDKKVHYRPNHQNRPRIIPVTRSDCPSSNRGFHPGNVGLVEFRDRIRSHIIDNEFFLSAFFLPLVEECSDRGHLVLGQNILAFYLGILYFYKKIVLLAESDLKTCLLLFLYCTRSRKF
jgi:hypothetical protein